MQIGTQVKVVSSESIRSGTTGLVVANRSARRHTVGVEFNTTVPGGHSCDGAGRPGACKWLAPSQIVEVRTQNEGGSMSGNSLVSAVKSLGRFARKNLDKDVRAFVELGLMDDSLEVTDQGMRFAIGFIYQNFKKELGEEARKEIEEIKEDEDCK